MPSDTPPDNDRPRASRNVRLVLMGVAGAALLYSCTPAIGPALGALPSFWLFGNPFYRGPSAPAACGPNVPGNPQCATGSTSSSGGGGGSGSTARGGSSSSSSSVTTSGQSSGSSASQSTSSRGGFGSSAASHGSSGGSS